MGEHYLPIDRDTPQKREIHVIARMLKLDRRIVFAACVEVWFWFDENSTDGLVAHTRLTDIDELTRIDGFGAALACPQVGWISEDADGLRQVGFGTHRPFSHKELRHRGRATLQRLRQTGAVPPPSQRTDSAPSVERTVAAQKAHGKRTESAPRYRKRINTPDPEAGPVEQAHGQCADTDSSPPSIRAPLPEWDELQPYLGTTLDTLTGGIDTLREGVFKALKLSMLTSPPKLVEWWRTQRAVDRPAIGDQDAHAILMLALAIECSKCRESTLKRGRLARFVHLVSHGEWDAGRPHLATAIQQWHWIVERESQPVSPASTDSAGVVDAEPIPGIQIAEQRRRESIVALRESLETEFGRTASALTRDQALRMLPTFLRSSLAETWDKWGPDHPQRLMILQKLSKEARHVTQ